MGKREGEDSEEGWSEVQKRLLALSTSHQFSSSPPPSFNADL